MEERFDDFVEAPVPLSEEELRLLEQMERALEAEDPRFVSALEGRTLVRAVRLRAIFGVATFLTGGAAVGVGLAMHFTWLSVLGFVLMVLGASVALSQWRSRRFVAALGAPADPGERSTPSSVTQVGAKGRGEQFRVIQGGRSEQKPPTGLRRRYARWLDHLDERWKERRRQGM